MCCVPTSAIFSISSSQSTVIQSVGMVEFVCLGMYAYVPLDLPDYNANEVNPIHVQVHILYFFHSVYYTSFLYTVPHSCILYPILVYCTPFLYTVLFSFCTLYPVLYTVPHSCILHPIFVYCTSFLYTIPQSCILYIIFVYCNPFLYTIPLSVYCTHSCILHPILVYYTSFLYTIYHSCILYIILVYYTSFLYTIPHSCILYIILVYCTFSCIADIDECSISLPCDPNQNCINTVGSYYCTCRHGYVKNGSGCESEYTVHSTPSLALHTYLCNVHMCILMHAHTHTQTNTCTLTTRARAHTHIHTHTNIRTQTHAYTHTRACAHTHTHTDTHTHTHTHIHTHTYTHTHTHTHTTHLLNLTFHSLNFKMSTSVTRAWILAPRGPPVWTQMGRTDVCAPTEMECLTVLVTVNLTKCS